jgi:glyoxylate reductase
MGRIGEAVARRARGFGMTILYHNRTRLPEAQEAVLGVRYVDFPTLLAESDFVSLHCPLTPETRHAFGRAQFQAMKRTAVFINTTRGPVVDEPALAAALRAGEIFAAGLDVFEEEPTVHPDLLACENAVLIPHLGSASQETRARMGAMAVANVLACLQGEPPPNCLNPEVLS